MAIISTTVSVSDGVVSGATVVAGGTLILKTGGEAFDTLVTNGGTLIAAAGGIDVSSTLQGGSETTTPAGLILGATGGYSPGVAGAGADASTVLVGDLINDGTIVGGAGGIGLLQCGAGGTGVYLDGGTLTNAGTIAGGVGGIGLSGPSGAMGDAVVFGSAAASLVIDPGAAFIGQVAADGAARDTLILSAGPAGGTGSLSGLGTQFTGFAVLDVAASASWKEADTGRFAGSLTIEGTLSANGLTLTGSLLNQGTLAGSGPGGTGLTFNGVSAANAGLIVGGSGKRSQIAGSAEGGAGAVIGGGVLSNSGTIMGGAGGFLPLSSNPGGVGLSLSGGTVSNQGSITGGAGGNGLFNGGAGGDGLDETGGSLGNSGVIAGGAGSFGPSAGGAGGVGVTLGGGVVGNTGIISGGAGGSGNGSGAAGGAGAVVVSGTFSNAGLIEGGAAGASQLQGGAGGAGVALDGGTLITSGTIAGGLGAVGGQSAGASGDAVCFGSASATLVIDPGARFLGTVAGNAAAADVLVLGAGSINAIGTLSGLGTQFTGFSTLDVAAGATWQETNGTSFSGLLDNAGSLTIHGLVLTGTVLNDGTIAGGAPDKAALILDGGSASNTGVIAGAADGGVGVLIQGGTLETAGTISGGGNGAAIAFGQGPATLILDAGAVLQGALLANAAADDALVLNGGTGTLEGFGTDISGFSSLTFAADAAWTVDVTASTSTVLAGFTSTDTLDLAGLGLETSVSGTAGSFTFAGGSGGVTLAFAASQGLSASSFVLASDGHGGTLVTLAETPATTIALQGYFNSVTAPQLTATQLTAPPQSSASGATAQSLAATSPPATRADLRAADVSLITKGSGSAQTVIANGIGGTVDAGAGPANVVVTNSDQPVAVTGGRGFDGVNLGNGNDTVLLSGLFNSVTLGNGNDSIYAGHGHATVTLGHGTGRVTLAGVGNSVALGAGQDTVFAGVNDRIVLDGTSLTLDGGKGATVSFLGGASAGIDDRSTDMTVLYGPSSGSLTLADITQDRSFVLDFQNGAGGFTSYADVLKTLSSDGHGGTLLTVSGSGAGAVAIDFLGTARTALSPALFHFS